MEKSLTIKELSAYLPYGLKVLNAYNDRVETLAQLNSSIEEAGLYFKNPDISDYFAYNLFKPLLRPLSDLTKEIEHNGEMFVPIVRLRKLFYKTREKTDGDAYLSQELSFKDGRFFIQVDDYKYTSTSRDKYEDEVGYEISILINQKMHEWKFDLYSLIENHLAVDINTTEK